MTIVNNGAVCGPNVQLTLRSHLLCCRAAFSVLTAVPKALHCAAVSLSCCLASEEFELEDDPIQSILAASPLSSIKAPSRAREAKSRLNGRKYGSCRIRDSGVLLRRSNPSSQTTLAM